MEFNVGYFEVVGLDKALKASGNPMRTEMAQGKADDKDFKRAKILGTAATGSGHDNFLKGIVVYFDVTAPLYWWKQAQRYHFMEFISSQSTMHSLMKFDVKTQCVKETNKEVLKIVSSMIKSFQKESNEKKKAKMWKEIVASLPCGFCLGASMVTNYQQLKTIYYQRRYHKLKEWHVFCDWILSLPHFKEFCIKEELNEK